MIRLIAPAVAMCLLAGIGVDASDRHAAPEGAEDYHRRVREAVAAIPYRIGGWVGVDQEIRQEALRILDANVSLSRTYRNLETGATATLLLVHCDDARRLLGHYPPVCYPSQGWTQVAASVREFDEPDAVWRATDYTFEYDTLQESARLGVLHFTALPDGRKAPDMALLEAAARDRRAKGLGGASIQIVLDANLDEQTRTEMFETLVKAAAPWLTMVGEGVPT